MFLVVQFSQAAMTNRTPDPEHTWEDSLQKLYRRKSDERKGVIHPIQEGDPQLFRAAAKELMEKSQTAAATNEAPRLLINGWDEILPRAFMDHEIILADPDTQKAETLLGKALWEILQNFGADEAYVFLALIAKAGENNAHWQAPIHIQYSELIQLLGWERSKITDRPIAQFTSILDLVQRVCKLSANITVTAMDAKNVHEHTASQINSPFWTLIGTNYISRLGRTSSSRSSDGSYRSGYPKDLTFTVVPGHWLTPFIQHSPTQVEALMEFSEIARSILLINPTRKKLASRLAIFITAITPLHQSATYRVRDLLDQIEDKSLETHHKTDETQTRLLLRWNNALQRLKHLDWVIEFDDDTYPTALRPIGREDGEDEDETSIPGRFENWFNTWLNGRLMLRSSSSELRIEDIRLGSRLLGSRLSRAKRQRVSAPQTPGPIAGKMLDVALTLKGWSKAQLSYQLHMDRSMVTHWIKGNRPISTDQRKRLWKILGKELMAAQKIRY